jgi:ATP-dependent Clp protease ATP-binding subunit ClpA
MLSVVEKGAGLAVGPNAREAWKRYLSGLAGYLKRNLKGQDDALERVARGVTAAILGMNDTSAGPLASFLFLGPTGVGKTQSAKLFNEYVYGPAQPLEIIFCNEYPVESKFKDFARKLEQVIRRNPSGTTILFDEIEKGHEKLRDVFLSLLDEGLFTATSGERLSVHNFIITMTTNLGSNELALMENSLYTTMERQVLDFARGALRPELFNRITERIVFRVLGLEVQRLIIRELIEKKLRLLSVTLGMALTYDAGPVEAFIYRLNKKGGQGARSLKQEVDRELNRAALPWALSEASPPEGKFCFNNGLGHLVSK